MLIQPTLDELNALKLNGMAITSSNPMIHAATGSGKSFWHVLWDIKPVSTV